MGRAATKGPEGEVCSGSSGAAQLLPASTVTLCPGQSPFRKISQGSWRLALPTVGQRSDLGGRWERIRPLNDLGCVHARASP